MSKVVFVFLLSLVSNISFGTIFIPLPIDKQVEEATSAAEVKLKASRVFKNSVGAIMTEYIFNIVESYNLSTDDLDQNQLKLTMPGGTFQGVTAMTDGAPHFQEGERTFLLLKKIESNIYLSNFTLGKYNIQTEEGKEYYVSEVFPSDPAMGKISKDKMIELLKTKWKTSFVPNTKSEMPIVTRVPPAPEKELKFRKRAPAQESAAKEEVPVFFWGAAVLVFFFFALIFFKLGQTDPADKRE